MKIAQPKFRILSIAPAVLVLSLSGCMTSGKFSCASPDGVSCMSTQQVYEYTNGAPVSAVTPAVEDRRASRVREPGKVAAHHVGATGDALTLSAPIQPAGGSFREAALSLGEYAPSMIPVAEGAPVALVPASVMRIWVAPWTDATGDLHMPGYVYSEVAERRWSVGGDVRALAPSSFDPNGPWTPSTNPSAK